MKRFCYLVVPYSPVGGELVNLGAARKIQAIVRILVRIGFKVRIVNTAHNSCLYRGTRVIRSKIGGESVVEIIPFTLKSRPIGKALNLLLARCLGRRFSQSPQAGLVWLYNTYAFESLFGIGCKQNVPVVLEIEDLPKARRRGHIDAKNRLDHLFFPWIVRRASIISCVNADVSRCIGGSNASVLMLPGLISPSWFDVINKPPFSRERKTVGYFGGLTQEKGAGVVLDMLRMLPAGWRLVVTGSGPYASAFSLAMTDDDRLSFIENATDAQVRDLMWSCDVLVNPHSSISEMANGVFPFKIFEFLSTGRLILSTPLPKTDIDISRCVVFCEPTVQSFVSNLLAAEESYLERVGCISAVADEVRARFSEEALANTIGKLIDDLPK